MNYITKEKLNKVKSAVEMPGQFYRVPKELFKSEKYRLLTPSAKIIYIELLDRVGLSIKNGWLDQYNRYYVKMSKESMPKVLGLSPKTFDRCKLQLIECELIKIHKVNKRVHHIYVLLPDQHLIGTSPDNKLQVIPRLNEFNDVKKGEIMHEYNFLYDNKMPDF